MPFEEPNASSDLVLVVEGNRLHVHKTVLSLHSPVFERMFSSAFAEREAREVPLPGKKYDSFVQFLREMYPVSSLEPLKDETLHDLLKLADEYQVDHIFQKCKAYIQSHLKFPTRKLTTDRILLYLWMCQVYKPISKPRTTLVRLAGDRTTAELQNSCYYTSVPVLAITDVALERIQNLEKQLQCEQDKNKHMHDIKQAASNKIADLKQMVENSPEKCYFGCYKVRGSMCKVCGYGKVSDKLGEIASVLK
ncbi:kelch repeat and BTB domain-containing protein 4-like [Littorina saxatilis]|uniref:kelch repeat and BTB domain-containing protein 4-like n=1 Tax=Littorina saxatilis TaxID=31220 RepID=UPI0038B6359B